MPRPVKTGLDYFPIDVDMDGDDKTELIEAKYGIEGFGILIKLLMRIYRNGYYYEWGEKEQLLFSKRVNVDINLINNIINDAVEWELFDRKMLKKYKILTSRGIQKRYLKAVSRRQQVEVIKQYLLLSKNCLNEYNNLINVDINSINDDIGTQRKGEYSTGEESTENSPEKEPPCPYEKIKDLYNTTCDLTKVKTIGEERKKHIKARWKQYNHTLTTFEELFSKTANSLFLNGKNDRGWSADFDWLMNENNFAKVLEGKYNKEQNKPALLQDRRLD
jgi:hypothetical protein